MEPTNHRLTNATLTRELSQLLGIKPLLLQDPDIEQKLILLQQIQLAGGLENQIYRLLEFASKRYKSDVLLCCPKGNIPYLYKGFRFSIWTCIEGKSMLSNFEIGKKFSDIRSDSFIKRLNGPDKLPKPSEIELLSDVFKIKQWLHYRTIKQMERTHIDALQKRLPNGTEEHKLVLKFLQNADHDRLEEGIQSMEGLKLGAQKYESSFAIPVSPSNRFALNEAKSSPSLGFQLIMMYKQKKEMENAEEWEWKLFRGMIETLIEANSLEGNADQKQGKLMTAGFG